MSAFSSALVFAWNFSPDCVKPVDERQRFSPHEHIHVRFSYHEASRSSTDVYALLAPYLPNTCVSCECKDRSGRRFVDDTIMGGSLAADLQKSAHGVSRPALILLPYSKTTLPVLLGVLCVIVLFSMVM